jgi:hypothetical protein
VPSRSHLKPMSSITATLVVVLLGFASTVTGGVRDQEAPVPVPGLQKIAGAYFSQKLGRSHLSALKAHGIDTLLVKFGHLTPDGNDGADERLKQFARWSRELELHLYPVVNLCGGPAEKAVLEQSARRETDAKGKRYLNTPCPLDRRFWNAVVVRRGKRIAELSREGAIAGFVLDPEMYRADHMVYDRGHCFCTDCWTEFFHSRNGHDVPEVAAAGREAELKDRDLLNEYHEWQLSQVEAMAREARQEIHAVNPDLNLGVLLLDRVHWVAPAWARGFGTAQRPVFCFSEATYTTGYKSSYIEEKQNGFRDEGASVAFVPGVWLDQFLPSTLPGHLARMSFYAAGYWLYTTDSLEPSVEKSTPPLQLLGSQSQYWSAIAEANAAFHRTVREGEASLPPLRQTTMLDRLGFKARQMPSLESLEPLVREGAHDSALATSPTHLRNEARYLFWAEAGQEFRVRLRGQRLGKNADIPAFVVLGPEGQQVAQGELPLGQDIEFQVKAPSTGVQTLDALTHGNAFSLTTTAPHWAIAVPKRGLALCSFAAPLYFFVPAGTDQFTVRITGTGGAEGALVKVLDPDGHLVEEQDTEGRVGCHVNVTVPERYRGKVWCARVENPHSGVFEDARIAWEGVPPYVSENSRALLVPAR